MPRFGETSYVKSRRKKVSRKTKIKLTTAQRKKIVGPRNRKRFQRKRAPFVETKARDHKSIWTAMGGTGDNIIDYIGNPQNRRYMVDTDDIALPAVPALFTPVWSYINPQVGDSAQDMLGRYICPKYMNVKVSVSFPETINNQIAPRVYLIWGWVSRTLNLNEFTAPKKSECTRLTLITHVLNYVKPYFDGDGQLEHTEYKEKVEKDFYTVGYKRIKFDPKKQLSIMPTRVVTEDAGGTMDNLQEVGDIPAQDHTLKFPLSGQKVRYDEGVTPSASADYKFLYPNKSHIPFWIIYNKDHTHVPAGNASAFSIRFNDKTWFTDS